MKQYVKLALLMMSNLFSRFVDSRRTVITRRLRRSIQSASIDRYTYRGLPLHKNPFDIAIYMMLLADLRPKVIVEIGSASGGSAKFFADQSQVQGLGARVYSFDIDPVHGLDQPNLTFLMGDILQLGNSPLPQILGEAPRPLLVVEDGPHTYDGCISALNFFHKHMHPGDMIVIEDGILRDFGNRYLSLKDGPNRAVRDFLKSHPNQYIVRTDLCDFFGRNATWNTDGYLERI